MKLEREGEQKRGERIWENTVFFSRFMLFLPWSWENNLACINNRRPSLSFWRFFWREIVLKFSWSLPPLECQVDTGENLLYPQGKGGVCKLEIQNVQGTPAWPFLAFLPGSFSLRYHWSDTFWQPLCDSTSWTSFLLLALIIGACL